MGVGEAISSLMRSREERAAGRAEDDGLSRKEFRECCPLIWSQPRALTTSLSLAVLLLACSVFFLIWLYLTTSWVFCFRAIGEEGFQMDAGRLKMQNDRPIFLTFRYTACMSLCVFIVARAEKGEQECIMRVFVKQNRE